jgi:hypothetical protein
MVTMEPGTRQMKSFETKLQMFENLNLSKKLLILKSKLRKISGVCKDYKRG